MYIYTISTFETIPVGSGRLGLDDGNSDNRANSGQLELELSLILAKIVHFNDI